MAGSRVVVGRYVFGIWRKPGWAGWDINYDTYVYSKIAMLDMYIYQFTTPTYVRAYVPSY